MPTEQQIFRRRRALAVVVLALLITVIWGIPQLLSGQSASDVVNTQDASTDVAALPECAPGVVAIEVMVGKIVEDNQTSPQVLEELSNFEPEDLPAMWYEITNRGNEKCKFNVGERVTFFTISSGDQTFYSSKDCNREGLADGFLALEPNKVYQSRANVWEKSYSSESGCGLEGNDPVPAAGATYKIRVEVSGVLSEEKRFVLN